MHWYNESSVRPLTIGIRSTTVPLVLEVPFYIRLPYFDEWDVLSLQSSTFYWDTIAA